LLRFTFMKRTFAERETEQTSRRFFKRVPIRWGRQPKEFLFS